MFVYNTMFQLYISLIKCVGSKQNQKEINTPVITPKLVFLDVLLMVCVLFIIIRFLNCQILFFFHLQTDCKNTAYQ